MAITILLAAPSVAQLTAEDLIGDAVTDPTKYPEIDDAITRFSNRDVLGARGILEAARRNNPKLPPAGIMLAKLYVRAGNQSGARDALESAVKEHPDDPEVYLLLGEQAFFSGRTIEADALFDKSIELTESFDENLKRKRSFMIRGYAGRSAVNERREKWEAALEDLRKWIKVDPDKATAHNRLGRTLFMLDQASEGYTEFKKAYDLDPELPHPYVTVALLYDTKGMQSNARKAFQKALEQDGQDRQTLLGYSQWLIRIGEYDQAERILDRARRAFPDVFDFFLLSGVNSKMANKPEEAEKYLIQALALAPTEHNILNQLAVLLISQSDEKQRERALQFAQMDARLNGNNSESHITLAWVQYQLGNLNDANTSLQRGSRVGNLNADSNYFVARIMDDQGRTDMAIQLLNEAVDSEGGIFIHRRQAEELLKSLNSRQ